MNFSWRNRFLEIDSRFLLALNICTPLSLVVIVCDKLFFGHAVRDFLPSTPEDFVWFAFIFNFPHIMASMVTYAEKDYMKAYKWALLKSFVTLSVVSAFLLLVFSVNTFFVALGFFTIYHLIMQQYGISLMLMRQRPDVAFKIWSWLSMIAGGCVYLHVYRPKAFIALTDVTPQTIGFIAMLVGLPFAVLYYWRVLAKAPGVTRTSKIYYWASIAIVPASCLAALGGYPFFLVLIPRFVHDATAFTVYAVHDHNRNLTVTHNIIYRALKPLHISPVILCIPLSVALSWWFTMNQDDGFVLLFLITATLLHFHMEGYMWKRDMPHRKNVRFHVA